MVFTGLVMAAPQSQAVRVGDLSKSGRWFRSEFPGVAEVVPAPLLLGLPFALEVALALLARRVKHRECPPLWGYARPAQSARRWQRLLSDTPPPCWRQ